MMGKLLLLVAILAIAIVFALAAISFWRYFRLLRDPQNNLGIALHQKLPRWSIRMKIIMPVVAVVFAFNAVAAMLAFIYFVVRWMSGS
jgi:hypothetical protein